MANDEYREQHERDRARGLVARQETRQERAIRRAVAEEIAAAIEARITRTIDGRPHCAVCRAFVEVATQAREIGSREAGE